MVNLLQTGNSTPKAEAGPEPRTVAPGGVLSYWVLAYHFGIGSLIVEAFRLAGVPE